MAISETDIPPPTLPALLRRCGPLALFLDFDGVLAEIAPTPDSVEVTPETIGRLQSLNSALDGALAIISGRDITDVDTHLAPLALAVAGDHGNVRRTRGGDTQLLNGAALRAADEVARELRDRFAEDDGVLVEQKASAVAVHYRLAPGREADCVAAATAAALAYPELSFVPGKMVAEVRAAGASKGEAVRGFMREAPFEGRTPVFVGDDVTDEDGFAAVQAQGGFGIKVGAGETVARYRIGGTPDVPAVLDAIIKSRGWVN